MGQWANVRAETGGKDTAVQSDSSFCLKKEEPNTQGFKRRGKRNSLPPRIPFARGWIPGGIEKGSYSERKKTQEASARRIAP